MFVGHAAVAFALVGAVALNRGWDGERALTLALLAGIFAALPDIDIAYALVGVVGAAGGDAPALASAFWSTGNVVHRTVTHSLVIALPVAALVALRTAGPRARGASTALAAVLVVVVGVVSGPLGAVVMLLFVVGAAAVGSLAARHTAFAPRAVFAAALVGLASHPFGDLFTGEPPAMLYPFDAVIVADRVALAADPTLHLLAAFGIELATVWAAVAVICVATGLQPTMYPRATLGAGYAASIVLIPAPTLDLSYPFVFSVLGVGLVGALPRVRLVRPDGPTVEAPDWLAALLTGLAAITVAWLAYTAAYVVIG